MITKNVGTKDRVVRVVVGLVLLAVSALYLIAFWQIIGYVAAVILVITGLVGYCGIYQLFGISTCPVDKK